MSNLETAPAEMTCTDGQERADGHGQLLHPREVPLGGPRAMTVRRTLPQRARSLIGAWCFVDHYGPDDVSQTGGMRVAGHPHTGLQTVSWLFSGFVEHRDTLGTHEYVRPGELNLMTAGAGIAHSEYSTPDTTVLHGAQLWLALPDAARSTSPNFAHYAPPTIQLDGASALVFLGSLLGHTSPVETFTPLLGAEMTLSPRQRLSFDVTSSFEHGLLVDTGAVSVAGASGSAGELIYVAPGTDRLTVDSTSDYPTRILLLGGQPLGERIVMWWNFVGRTHEEIVDFRTRWERERSGTGPTGSRTFGAFPSDWEHTLPAPELPNARLKTRG